MIIPLVKVDHVRGIYGPNKDSMPARMRWLRPDAAASFAQIADVVTVSDMFRSPDSSLQAVREGRGAAAPGRSSHNYGRAIDVDIDHTMRDLKFTTKRALDDFMAGHGWHCWRPDHAMRTEAWHYFYAQSGFHYTRESGVAWWADTMAAEYPAALTVKERQAALKGLGLYGGEVDGVPGPLTSAAIRAFKGAWGEADDRTIAYVAWHKDWAATQKAAA